MQKRDFIQQASTQFLANVEWDLDKAITYAEKLWQRLSERGYGDSKPPESRATVDAYTKLPAKQKQQFDAFWTAFAYKKGRARAAMRWSQIGELSDDKMRQVLAAAQQTALERKSLPEGQVPKMAEGWLSEMRYDDIAVTQGEKQQKTMNNFAIQVRQVMGDLNHAKGMAEKTEDEFWPKEVLRLTERLRELRNT